jgi:hypothetical protein
VSLWCLFVDRHQTTHKLNISAQSNGNKFATGQTLKKPVEIVKGRILAGGAPKSPEPWLEESCSQRCVAGFVVKGANLGTIKFCCLEFLFIFSQIDSGISTYQKLGT